MADDDKNPVTDMQLIARSLAKTLQTKRRILDDFEPCDCGSYTGDLAEAHRELVEHLTNAAARVSEARAHLALAHAQANKIAEHLVLQHSQPRGETN